MKRSKFFLAATSCLLAFASVVAVRAAKVGSSKGFFYTIVDGIKTCKQLPKAECRFQAGALETCLTINASAITTIVYTKFISNLACANKLKYIIQ